VHGPCFSPALRRECFGSCLQSPGKEVASRLGRDTTRAGEGTRTLDIQLGNRRAPSSKCWQHGTCDECRGRLHQALHQRGDPDRSAPAARGPWPPGEPRSRGRHPGMGPSAPSSPGGGRSHGAGLGRVIAVRSRHTHLPVREAVVHLRDDIRSGGACPDRRAISLARTGFKRTGYSSGNTGVVELSTNVKSNALHSDLAEVVAAWGRLPAAVRAGIVAMVRASGG